MSSLFTQAHSEEPVEIAPYDPKWPALFEKERKLIVLAIGEIISNMEHIGSTAVPSLSAKPIIDIMVSVQSLDLSKSSPRLWELLAMSSGETGMYLAGSTLEREIPGVITYT